MRRLVALPHFETPQGSSNVDDHDKPTLTEIVSAVLACSAVAATIWLACYQDDAAAKTGLTGLIGASSAYFLTKQMKTNGNGNGKPPASEVKPPSEGVA